MHKEEISDLIKLVEKSSKGIRWRRIFFGDNSNLVNNYRITQSQKIYDKEAELNDKEIPFCTKEYMHANQKFFEQYRQLVEKSMFKYN